MTREERRLFIKQVYLEDRMRIPNEKPEDLQDLRASEAWGRLMEARLAASHVVSVPHTSVITKPANELSSQWKTRGHGLCLHGHSGWTSREISKNISPQ